MILSRNGRLLTIEIGEKIYPVAWPMSHHSWSCCSRSGAEGHCYRCLSKDHQAADCHGPFKCLLYFASGNRAHHCHAPRPCSATPPSGCRATKAPSAAAPSLEPLSMPPHRLVLHGHDKPGSLSRHANQAEIVAKSCANMVLAENAYHSHGVIAVMICEDPWFHITRDVVLEAFGLSLSVHRWDTEVDFFLNKGFLVLLPTPAFYDRVLVANAGVPMGRVKLQLLPWTRMAGGEATKLSFKICLCIEGVPHHTRQSSIIK
jgi:hypothetical protein